MFLLYKKKVLKALSIFSSLARNFIFVYNERDDTKENIIQLAHSIGISKIGFTTADDFAYLEKSLRLAVEEGRNSGFEHKNIEERIQPKLSLSLRQDHHLNRCRLPPQTQAKPQKRLIKRKIRAQQLGIRLPLCPSRQAQPLSCWD